MNDALFRLDEIENDDSARFTVDLESGRTQVMAIRKKDTVFVYVNSCPHVGAPLDIRAGRFLNAEKSHILCANHGALFRIDDGVCTHGPCIGGALRPVPVTVRNGRVYLV